jgi:hypothetical protein
MLPMRADSWTPVRIVNKEDLPVIGSPMIAVFMSV